MQNTLDKHFLLSEETDENNAFLHALGKNLKNSKLLYVMKTHEKEIRVFQQTFKVSSTPKQNFPVS